MLVTGEQPQKSAVSDWQLPGAMASKPLVASPRGPSSFNNLVRAAAEQRSVHSLPVMIASPCLPHLADGIKELWVYPLGTRMLLS